MTVTALPSARFALSLLIAACAAAPALAADADDVAMGRELATRICADCHAVRPAEVQSPRQSAPSFEDIASVPGLTPIALKVALRSSHREMPNLVLDENETERIVAYILSLPGTR